MKLTIQFATNQGVAFVGEASSIVEFEAIRDYLTKQGFGIGTPAEQQPEQPKADAGAVKESTKPAATSKPKAADKKADAEAKKEPAAETPKADAKAADSAKTAAAPTLEDVVAELTKVADEFGMPEALILNKRFGVKKAGELKEAQYADYIKFAKHCLDDKIAPSGSHPDFDAGSEEDVTALV